MNGLRCTTEDRRKNRWNKRRKKTETANVNNRENRLPQIKIKRGTGTFGVI